MNYRGVYRGVYSSLIDDPDFQQLSARARHVFLTLRLCSQNNAASIFRLYLPVLQVQTGYTRKAIESVLKELEDDQWLSSEKGIVWIRNGLRYDPWVHLANDNHRRAVEKAVFSLPRCGLVTKFCEYYEIDMASRRYRKAIDRPSRSPSIPSSYIPNSDKPISEVRNPKTEHENTRNGAEPTRTDRDASHVSNQDSSQPMRLADLPAVVAEAKRRRAAKASSTASVGDVLRGEGGHDGVA